MAMSECMVCECKEMRECMRVEVGKCMISEFKGCECSLVVG